MRSWAIKMLGSTALLLAGSLWSATVSQTVVVRNHLTAVSSEIVVNGIRGDTTAGSWVGTLLGIDGLPTPPISTDPPYILLRRPLQTTSAPPGWPGRIAGRLDLLAGDSSFRPQCSGSLVGPKHFLTAAHCVVAPTSISSIQEQWVTDSYYVRPGLDHGQDYPGTTPGRGVKTYGSKTVFSIASPYEGDNDWAILELAEDVGTRLGWAQVVPMSDDRENKPMHMLSYPIFPPACPTGTVCDTATRRDTLHHSWSYLWRYHAGTTEDWFAEVPNWKGESGSGSFDCANDPCKTGPLHVRATPWKTSGLSSIDSVMSGVISAILKSDVQIPSSVAVLLHSDFDLHLEGGSLHTAADRDGEWQILQLDGRSINPSTFGRNLSIPADRLPHGVALIVFRTPGHAPITRQWIRQ